MAKINTELKILLVEDNVVNQKIIKLFLDKTGLESDLANDATEAIDLVKANSYDLILMDVNLPGMDGIEATQIIRKDIPEDKQPLIYGISAEASQEEQAHCLEAGMDKFIEKPVGPREFEALTGYLSEISK